MKVGKHTKLWHQDKSVLLECTIGDHCTIHAFVWIGNGVRIGDRCKIQSFSFIPEGVTLEEDVFIGPHVCFTNDKRPPSYGDHWAKTLVRKGASIGAGAIILPGITIGEGAMIGAGAIVTKDVDAKDTVIGNPARTVHTKVLFGAGYYD